MKHADQSNAALKPGTLTQPLSVRIQTTLKKMGRQWQIQFMALSHATVSVQRMPAKSNGLRKYYRLNFDLMVDVVWIIALIVLIIVVDGPAIFA